jgi:hypothetical protein
MSNVVKFPFGVSRKVHARKLRASKNANPEERREEIGAQIDNRLSVTAANGRLRKERDEVWQMAEATTRYWRARFKFENAVLFVQSTGALEGSFHPTLGDRQSSVDKWRAALV